MKLTQKEALINEYKGNLFEFLLAKRLALHYGLGTSFESSLSSELRERLGTYEDLLGEFEPLLLRKLPELSQSVFEKILPILPLRAGAVSLVGKDSEFEGEKAEADIIIKSEKELFLSLKLCKEHAFVNTKSAGVKSFFEKYFSDFHTSTQDQAFFNEKIDKDFYKMAHRLYEKVGLEFKGGFDTRWKGAGYSELPGELEPELSELVLDYYADLTAQMKAILVSYYQRDPALFKKALFSLAGFSKPQLLQVICFHGKEEQEKYKFKALLVNSSEAFAEELSELEFREEGQQRSAFELQLKSYLLQIRCKPMNKFTVPSLKVNCSLKKVVYE